MRGRRKGKCANAATWRCVPTTCSDRYLPSRPLLWLRETAVGRWTEGGGARSARTTGRSRWRCVDRAASRADSVVDRGRSPKDAPSRSCERGGMAGTLGALLEQPATLSAVGAFLRTLPALLRSIEFAIALVCAITAGVGVPAGSPSW